MYVYTQNYNPTGLPCSVSSSFLREPAEWREDMALPAVCADMCVLPNDKSETIEIRATKFGTRDYIEAPWSGIDF